MPEDSATQTPTLINTHPLKPTCSERSACFNYCAHTHTHPHTGARAKHACDDDDDDNVCICVWEGSIKRYLMWLWCFCPLQWAVICVYEPSQQVCVYIRYASLLLTASLLTRVSPYISRRQIIASFMIKWPVCNVSFSSHLLSSRGFTFCAVCFWPFPPLSVHFFPLSPADLCFLRPGWVSGLY